ncbi:MAG: HAMP domain-containing protein, partial [Leptospiraceae bacterium]|nr:HAMP domain-containing protein [Leptospiraceae bacterium]
TNHFQILFLDPATGEVQKSLKLRSPGTEKAYPFGVFSLAYDEVTRSYFGVSTVSIVRIDMKTGEVQEVPGFGFGPAKSQSVYRELVAPMIRVRIGTKITYLYSAILVDRETHINYALDSTQSDIHSFVGIADSNPAEDNIRDVILKREIYLSDIQPWEDWGLLKSSYVPILNREGDAVAYAGADVDITIIESRTRLALLQVVIIGVVALAAGLAIAYFITERLTRPIHVLKQSALQVAAGDFGNEIHVSNPAELTRLSGSLTRLSRSLQETVTSLTGENYRLEEKRRRNELINLIYSLMKHKSAVDLVDGSRTRSQGIYEDARYLAVWIVPEGEDKLDSARLNSDLYRITRRLLQQSSEHYLESMEPFLGAMEFLMLLHKGSGQVEILNSADLDFYPVDDKKKSQRHSLKPGKHRIDSNGLAAVYVDWSDNRKDRAASLQGAARPRIREWAESAGHADRFLEVIL